MAFERVYDYSDAPTIKRFNESDKFFRLLMGPFGCLSNDTEYLSLLGWKRFDQYLPDDKIAEFDLLTSKIEFKEPISYVKLPCDSFLHLKNRYGIDQMLSDEHTVLFNTAFKPSEWRTISAIDLSKSHNKLKDGWSGRIPTTFKAPEMHGLSLSDDEIRLMVAISADGNFPENSHKNYCLVCVRKQRKKDRLRLLLINCGIEWVERNYPQRPTETTFVFDAPENNKLLWKYISANEKQLSIIADEFVYWDGCEDCYGGRIFSSTIKENSDFIQYALATTGVRSTIAIVDKDNDKWKDNYRVYANTGATFLSMRQAPPIERVPSQDGFKYCFATTTGFFVARRNGKIFITGNSGKSSGCVAEIIDRGMRQEPSKDGIRRTKWAVVRNCYDDKTEVLTEKNGWKLFKDVNSDDKIATLINGYVVYKKPDKIVSFDYNGEMLGFDGESVNFLVTPEHKMYVSMRNARKKKWSEYKIREAKDIYRKHGIRVKRDALWKGIVPGFDIGFMEWFGFWMAKGSAAIYNHDGYNKYRCVITQKENLDYVRGLFRNANIAFTENKDKDRTVFLVSITTKTKKIIDMLLPLGKAINKTVPQWLKDSPPEYIIKFLKGYLAGDGCHDKNGTVRASTASKQLADDIQELALKSNNVVNVKELNNKGEKQIINGKDTKFNSNTNIVTFMSKKRFEPILNVNKDNTNHLKGWYKEQYNGKVYCAEMEEVPIYVRRNGKGFWCIRSYRQLEDTTMATFFYWLPWTIFGTFNKTEHRYIINNIPISDGTRVEIEVIFRALDRPDHVANLLSLELTGAWFNEIREMPKLLVDAMEGRCRRYPKDVPITWTGIIADTNPPDQSSWIFKRFEEEIKGNEILEQRYEIFKQPSGRSENAENLKHLSGGAAYYNELAIGKDPEFIKVYIDGEYGYVRDGKAVYSNYMDSVHCSDKDIQAVSGFPIILGADYGLTPAIVICQYLQNGSFNVLKEFYEEDMPLRSFMEIIVRPYILTKYRGFEIVTTGDPAGMRRNDSDGFSCYMELKRLGFPASPAHTNSLIARINSVDSLLTRMVEGKPAFKLSPCCEMLRKGFVGEYKLHKFTGANERYSEVPVKNAFSHPHDALQYAALLVEKGINGARGLFGNRYENTSSIPKKISMTAWV